MSNSFLKISTSGEFTIIEVFPDMYVKWQPVTESQVGEKVSLLESKLKPVLKGKKFLLVIECDRAIFFDKINFVLLSKMSEYLTVPVPVIMRHCGPHLKELVSRVRFSKNLKVYFNDVFRK